MSKPGDTVPETQPEPKPKLKRVPYSIFNDKFSNFSGNSATTFPSFQRLPAELRLRIWTDAASVPRFLRLHLDGQELATVDPGKLYKGKNELGNIISGYRYCVKRPLKEWQPSVLSSVCHEARATFHRIYRVRFPIRTALTDCGGTYMYINPDNDIICVFHRNTQSQYDAIIPCYHDLMAYDPKGIGITRLALGYGLNQFLEANSKQLEAVARQSIAKLLLTSLQEVYVLQQMNGSRAICGGMDYHTRVVHLNRSIPLQPESQFYHEIGYDPRPIEANLPYFGSRLDPRFGIYCWNQFKANFGGGERQIPVKYLICECIPMLNGAGLSTRQDFVDDLQHMDEWWEKCAPGVSAPPWGNVRSKEEFERERVTLPQVVGMWELPAEAFGDVPQTPDEKYNNGWHAWKPNELRDLSKFHPKLWCFNLA